MTLAQWVAFLCLAVGAALVVGGVYMLAGPGWAVLSGSAPFLVLGLIILIGVSGGR